MTDTEVDKGYPRSNSPGGAKPAQAAMSRGRYGIGLVLLVAFALGTCIVGLGRGPVMDDHECIVAQSARQCVESGNWLIPYLGEIPRIRKTPLGIWSVGLSSYVFDEPGSRPVSAYSARMPSAIAGVLNALLVCWLGTMLYGRRAGLIAGFIAAGCVGTLLYARNAQVDMILTMFTTLSFALFWRGAMSDRPSRWAMVGFYVAFAAAMMAKFPLPGATVGVGLAVFWLVTVPILLAHAPVEASPVPRTWGQRFFVGVIDQIYRIGKLWFIPGVFLFAVLSGAWLVYAITHVDNAVKLWRMEYLDRFSGDLSAQKEPLLYYIPVLLALMTPYLLSLPEAIGAVFMGRYRECRNQLAYAFTWAIVGTVFISLGSYKRPHYLLSMLPAYCLLLAPVIDRLFFGVLSAHLRTIRRACLVIPVLLVVAAIIGGIVVRREMADLLRAYMIVVVVLVVICSAASLIFAAGRRGLSFAALNVAVLASVMLGWPAVGQATKTHTEIQALADALQQHGVTRDDAIYWVSGRPDTCITFYSGYRIRRLINELEMTDLRSDRRTVGEELYRIIADRIRQRLAEPTPAYLMMASWQYEMMRRETDIRASVLFEVSGFHEQPGDDLIVITQPMVKPATTRAAATATATATTTANGM
jgi:4-amino-4-deoxy-L-arabinose transferase-like glycosyltransferase